MNRHYCTCPGWKREAAGANRGLCRHCGHVKRLHALMLSGQGGGRCKVLFGNNTTKEGADDSALNTWADDGGSPGG